MPFAAAKKGSHHSYNDYYTHSFYGRQFDQENSMDNISISVMMTFPILMKINVLFMTVRSRSWWDNLLQEVERNEKGQ